MNTFFKTKEGRICWFSKEDTGMILLNKNVEKALKQKPDVYSVSTIIRVEGEDVYVWNTFLNKETKIALTKEQLKEKIEDFPPAINPTRIEKIYKGEE